MLFCVLYPNLSKFSETSASRFCNTSLFSFGNFLGTSPRKLMKTPAALNRLKSFTSLSKNNFCGKCLISNPSFSRPRRAPFCLNLNWKLNDKIPTRFRFFKKQLSSVRLENSITNRKSHANSRII